MEELIRRIRIATDTVRNLEQHIQRLRQRERQLLEEIAALEEQLSARSQENAVLREKEEKSSGFIQLPGEDSIILRTKIDNFLKEIDICLEKLEGKVSSKKG